MTSSSHVWRSTALAVAASAALLSACSSSDPDSATTTAVSVTASDDSCVVTPDGAPAGDVVFSVANTGSQTTEFYVYASDGTTIVGEVENIGPGLTRELTASLEPGGYVTACKPGMTGDGIRGGFEVAATG